MNRDIFCELNDLEKYNPIFSKEEILIDNIDKEYLLRNKMGITLHANKMAYNILLLCNGENTIENIIDIINERYEVSKEEIKLDVLVMLHIAWKKYFLKWKNKNVYESLYEKVYMNEVIFSRVFPNEIAEVVEGNAGITHSGINEKTWYRPQTIQNIYNNEEEFCYCIKKNSKVFGIITLCPEILVDREKSYIGRFRINFIDMRKMEKKVWESFIKWCIYNFFQTEKYKAPEHKVFLEMETISDIFIIQEMTRLEFKDATIDKNRKYRFWDKKVAFQ